MKIDESILTILSRVTIKDNIIFLTCGQLDRKQYLDVNVILENMGGKWDRKAKGHIFSDNPEDKLEQVLLTGEITLPKKYGYFSTPYQVVVKLLNCAKLNSPKLILEPSAGQGHIVDCILKNCIIDCIELLSDNVKILREKGYKVLQADFLTVEPKAIYDRVIMNPPFEKQQDIDHVNHAWKFLVSGGRLVSIMASGIIYRENKKTLALREMIDKYGCIEQLPDNSFKDSGTMINTCIVIMDKP